MENNQFCKPRTFSRHRISLHRLTTKRLFEKKCMSDVIGPKTKFVIYLVDSYRAECTKACISFDSVGMDRFMLELNRIYQEPPTSRLRAPVPWIREYLQNSIDELMSKLIERNNEADHPLMNFEWRRLFEIGPDPAIVNVQASTDDEDSSGDSSSDLPPVPPDQQKKIAASGEPREPI